MGVEETPPRKEGSRWPLLALGLVTLVGLTLRLTNVGESLWLDELHTGWVVKDAWSDVAWRAQIGNQSPLWFYAVKLITTVGGESELTLRLLSLLAGTALIPATYWVVDLLVPKESSSSPLACGLAASLIAVDPNCIFYATEARPYACLQLCAAVQLGLFWQILQAPTTKLRISWMLLTALAFHLHYTGILILLGELVVLLGYYLLSRQPVPYRPWRAAFDWQVAVMLCLPAIGHVLEVGRRREMWESMSEVPQWSTLVTLFPLYPALALGLLACGLSLVDWHRGGTMVKPQASWVTLGAISLWLFVPLLAVFAVAHFELARMFFRRYLIAFAIGPPLLTALLLTGLRRPAAQWSVAAVVLGFVVFDSNIVPQLRYDGRAVGDRNEDWRGAMAWLRQEYEGGEIEVFAGLIEDDWLTGLPLDVRATPSVATYLQFPLHSLYPVPAPKQSEQSIKWTVSRGLGNQRRLWAGISHSCVREESFGDVIVTQWRPDRRRATSTQSQSSIPPPRLPALWAQQASSAPALPSLPVP